MQRPTKYLSKTRTGFQSNESIKISFIRQFSKQTNVAQRALQKSLAFCELIDCWKDVKQGGVGRAQSALGGLTSGTTQSCIQVRKVLEGK